MTSPRLVLRRSSARARRAAMVACTLLAAGPFAFTLARDGTFESRVEIRPIPPRTAPQLGAALPQDEALPAYLRRLLHTEALRIGVVAELDHLVGADQLDGALRLDERPGRPPGVTVVADSPGRARELARVTGRQLAAASSREVGASAARALARSRGLAAPQRDRQRETLLAELVANAPARIYPAAPPTAAPVDGIDRRLERLLGTVPPRPATALVLLSGALVGIVAGWFILAASVRRRCS